MSFVFFFILFFFSLHHLFLKSHSLSQVFASAALNKDFNLFGNCFFLFSNKQYSNLVRCVPKFW